MTRGGTHDDKDEQGGTTWPQHIHHDDREHQRPSGAPEDERGDTHVLEGTHSDKDKQGRAPMARRHHTATTMTRGAPHDHKDKRAPHSDKDDRGAPTTMAGVPHNHKDKQGGTAEDDQGQP